MSLIIKYNTESYALRHGFPFDPEVVMPLSPYTSDYRSSMSSDETVIPCDSYCELYLLLK